MLLVSSFYSNHHEWFHLIDEGSTTRGGTNRVMNLIKYGSNDQY